MPALAADWSCGDGLMGSYSGSKPANHTRYNFLSTDDETSPKKQSQTNGVQKLKHLAQRGWSNDGIPSPKMSLFNAASLSLQWVERRPIGPGLTNLGNTCFLNSVLQCLSYTPPLSLYLTSDGGHKRTCKVLNEFCMLCVLQDHLMRGQHSIKGQPFKPLQILNNLRNIAKSLTWGQQEDAHEFLRYVVDAMQKSCLAGNSGLDKFSKETTLVHHVFGGYLRSQVKCLRCHHASDTFDPFLDISIDLKEAFTLEQAFGKFVSPETLDIENAYKCERCKVKVNAQKRFTIHRTSNVLTVHLKRFDMNRMLGAKVSRHIKFPIILNVRPYMSQAKGEPVNYVLYGVLVHSGFSCNSGHYYCYVKAANNQWYCMNDSSVTLSSQNVVMDAEAYILFYVKHTRIVSYTNGKAPHTITKSDLAGGSGDHTFVSKKIIGPQLPPSLRSPPTSSPTNGAAANSKLNHVVTRIILKSKDKKPMTNGHTAKAALTLPLQRPTVSSLVPYLEPASDEDNEVNETPPRSRPTADKSSTKLSLSEYAARQEGKTALEEHTASVKNISKTTPVFLPRAVHNTKLSHSSSAKVLEPIAEADPSCASSNDIREPGPDSPPTGPDSPPTTRVAQPADSGSEPASPLPCVDCDSIACTCVTNKAIEHLESTVNGEQRTIFPDGDHSAPHPPSLGDKITLGNVAELNKKSDLPAEEFGPEVAKSHPASDSHLNFYSKLVDSNKDNGHRRRPHLSPNQSASSSRKNSIDKNVNTSSHQSKLHRHRPFSHRTYRGRHRSSSEERYFPASSPGQGSEHRRSRSRDACKSRYRSRRDSRLSLERRYSPLSSDDRWRKQSRYAESSGSRRHDDDSYRRHDHRSSNRRYSPPRDRDHDYGSRSKYRRFDGCYNRKRRSATPDSHHHRKRRRDSCETKGNSPRDEDRKPLLTHSSSNDDHQWVEVTKDRPLGRETTSPSRQEAKLSNGIHKQKHHMAYDQERGTGEKTFERRNPIHSSLLKISKVASDCLLQMKAKRRNLLN